MLNRLTDGNGHTLYQVSECVADTEKDIENLPKNVAPGSTAICIATSEVYMLNGSREWVKL